MVEQGDIFKTDGIPFPLIVLSGNLYNQNGLVYACPILKNVAKDYMTEYIESNLENGYVLCDSIRMIDTDARKITSRGRVSIDQLIRVLDCVQSIFDLYL